MFEFFFKYPLQAFSKGKLVLLSAWPVWMLALAIAVAAGLLGLLVWRRRGETGAALRAGAIWALQTALIAVLLLMFWQPALSVATLKPQQNIVAVVVDDSRSMATREGGGTRLEEAVRTLNNGLLRSLRNRFQVRLYGLGGTVQRIDQLSKLKADAPATRIGDGLRRVIEESSSLPVGAVVLLSDGADNTGGIDLATMNEIRRHHIPINTIGFGRERFDRDIELTDLEIPAKALTDSRVAAVVSLRQRGFGGRKVRVNLRDGSKLLASREITLKGDGVEQNETLLFNAGDAGPKTVDVSIDPLDGEQNPNNNRLARMMDVDASQRRILYVEGEPRWEYKFMRRALEDDKTIEIASILRTTQNKILVQAPPGPESEKLKAGFPTKVDDLFAYQGLIIGSVEANWFTPAQQELIKEFADRRGGGVLFLGGRFGLGQGGYNIPPFNEMLPVVLPDRKVTYFAQTPAYAELTAAGRDSLICRLDDDPEANVAHWKRLPYLMNFQDPGTPKPGALVLADALPTSKGRVPLLITENFGYGRTAVFATGGSWRWHMQMPLGDMSHTMFWRQLLGWLVGGTPGRVTTSVPKSVIDDDTHVHLTALVRDHTYLPAPDAQVEAHITGPGGSSDQVTMRPDPLQPGTYTADWDAEQPGPYLAEVVATRNGEELGRDVATFRREDGVAENFRMEQNRDLLEKLAAQTGGRYYRPSDVGRLGEEITYSDAGITVHENRDLWNMPVLFLLILILKSGEWLLRRRWGVI
jgi:uncharacterized membrane protein